MSAKDQSFKLLNVILWIAMLAMVVGVIFLVTAPKSRAYSIEDTDEVADTAVTLLSKAEIADVLLDNAQITIAYQLGEGYSLVGYDMNSGIDAEGKRVLDLRLYKTLAVKKDAKQVTIDLSDRERSEPIRILTQAQKD